MISIQLAVSTFALLALFGQSEATFDHGECNIENGVDISNKNVVYQFYTRNQYTCATQCAIYPPCIAWTIRTKDNYCWLMSDDSGKVEKEEYAWVTGTKECGAIPECDVGFEDHVMIENGVVISDEYKVNGFYTCDQDTCSSECELDPRCGAWTMDTSGNYCSLMSDHLVKWEQDGYVTGTKTCVPKPGGGEVDDYVVTEYGGGELPLP